MATIPEIMEWLNAGATVLLSAITIWVIVKIVNNTPSFVLMVKTTIEEITTALTVSSSAVRQAVELIDKYDTRESQVMYKIEFLRRDVLASIDKLSMQQTAHSDGSNESYHEMCDLANKILDNLSEHSYISTSDINELRRILSEMQILMSMTHRD